MDTHILLVRISIPSGRDPESGKDAAILKDAKIVLDEIGQMTESWTGADDGAREARYKVEADTSDEACALVRAAFVDAQGNSEQLRRVRLAVTPVSLWRQ